MNKNQNELFELIQVAIGNRERLTRQLSADEWVSLRLEVRKHALLGIGYVGVTKLPREQKPPLPLLAQWVKDSERIKEKNKALNRECEKVCTGLERDGFDCCILKGQSNLVNYPEDLCDCRTAGDIDLWTLPHPEGIPIAVSSGGSAEYVNYKGIAGVVEYAREWRRVHGQEPIPWHRVLYYHVEVNTDCSESNARKGIEIELHYRPSYLNSPFRNFRLQRWFKENEPWGVCDAKIDGHVFPILPISTNVVYQLLHINKHLFEEGIGLRQLLDYYFVLRALHIEQGSLADRTQSMAQFSCKREENLRAGSQVIPSAAEIRRSQWAEGMGMSVKSNAEIMHTLSRFGMKKFTGAVMYVLQTVFAMPDEYLICQPNEKEGKFLLNEIMQAGNFGKYDDRIKKTPSIPLLRGKTGMQLWHAWEKTKHNLRLLTHYPEEVLCEPFFRVYHWIWRRLELWRY